MDHCHTHRHDEASGLCRSLPPVVLRAVPGVLLRPQPAAVLRALRPDRSRHDTQSELGRRVPDLRVTAFAGVTPSVTSPRMTNSADAGSGRRPSRSSTSPTSVVDRATATLAAAGSIDEHQVVAYDLAHAAAAVATGRAMLAYGEQGRRRGGAWRAPSSPTRSPTWPPSSSAAKPTGASRPDALDEARGVRRPPSGPPRSWPRLAADEGPRHLDGDFELVQDTFRRFAEDKIRPVAEHIHRHNEDIPDDIIDGPGRDGRVRPVDPGRVRRLQRGRRERVPRHGRRHRGAVARLARRRRLAHHPPRDPDPRAAGRRHRGAEAVVAAPTGHRRGDGRGRRHRARLRLRRGRREGDGHARPTAAG